MCETGEYLSLRAVIMGNQNREAHRCDERNSNGITQPSGAATRMSASLFRRLSAFFEIPLDQGQKAAKFAVLTPGPGRFMNVRNAPRVVIAPPIQNAPCFAV